MIETNPDRGKKRYIHIYNPWTERDRVVVVWVDEEEERSRSPKVYFKDNVTETPSSNQIHEVK